MTTLQEIEDAISGLSEEEFKHLREWLDEYEWDAQMERDAKAGKFDRFREEVKRKWADGDITPL